MANALRATVRKGRGSQACDPSSTAPRTNSAQSQYRSLCNQHNTEGKVLQFHCHLLFERDDSTICWYKQIIYIAARASRDKLHITNNTKGSGTHTTSGAHALKSKASKKNSASHVILLAHTLVATTTTTTTTSSSSTTPTTTPAKERVMKMNGIAAAKGEEREQKKKAKGMFELKGCWKMHFQWDQNSKGHLARRMRFNAKRGYQQTNSVSNAAALFSPHRCRVTIFAGVLPAGHRGLRFGSLPQSTFGATVTAHLSGLCVA